MLKTTPYRSIFILTAIFGLRMLGLFMVLPILSLYAQNLTETTPLLIGTALGCYGLSQAMLQIPFGLLSDFCGRKPIIVAGLLLFILGSIIAANSQSIITLILGRTLQGSGAIGSVLIAFATDITSAKNHSKAMAIIGIGIGASFFIAMLTGPIIYGIWSLQGIFYLTAILAFLCLIFFVPRLPNIPIETKQKNIKHNLKQALTLSNLLRCNFGIFALHAVLTACFISIPIKLQQFGFSATQQWKLYLPIMILTALMVFPLLALAEKKQITKIMFNLTIVSLMIASIALMVIKLSLIGLAIWLWVFLTSFSILEANLPAFVARFAPSSGKGTAMGVYSTSQFFGIFVGGISGGWLYGHYQSAGVGIFCLTLSIIWLLTALNMSNPHKATQNIA